MRFIHPAPLVEPAGIEAQSDVAGPGIVRGAHAADKAKPLDLDEPAAGMTDEETQRTGELLISLAGKHSLIVLEHDMTFVRQIAQGRKVTVLHQGTQLCEGSFEEVQSNPKVREVYLGRGKGTK